MPWGSVSASSTRFFFAPKAAAKFTAVVVLPTPPFWLAMAMILPITSSFPSMSRSVCVYHPRGPVRSLPGEAILPQSECRARCVLWTLYHKAGRKGSAARGKRKKICLFRQMSCTIPCGRISALSGLPMASHLPQRGRRVSAPCRGFTDLIHVKRKRQRSFRLAASPVGNE